MKKSVLLIALVASIASFVTTHSSAQTTDTTKKATTSVTNAPAPTEDIVSVLAGNTDYSTVAGLIKTAGLETVLKTGGPYTIFAPNNIAFSKLSAGKLDSLAKDPVKLAALLKGHVVTGKYAKADIIKALTAGKEKATLPTLDGQSLILSISPAKTLQLTNAAGVSAEVTLYDLFGTNGVANGLNGILLPAK